MTDGEQNQNEVRSIDSIERAEMLKKVLELIPKDFPLQEGLCHEEACRLGEEILGSAKEQGLGVSLLQLDGHTLLVLTDLKTIGLTDSKVGINVGSGSNPEYGLKDEILFYWERGKPNGVLGNPYIKQIESIILETPEDIKAARVEFINDAIKMPKYYPSK